MSEHPKIVLLDTGIELTHKEFIGQHITVKDFCYPNRGKGEDWVGHGTHCAGVIMQLAPLCNLLVGRVRTRGGLFIYGALLDGLLWALDEKADIVCICSGDRLGDSAAEKLLNKLSTECHTTVIAAIGNYGPDDNRGHYPALYDSVIPVGSTDDCGELMDFTEFPSKINLVCLPGVDCRGPWLNDGYKVCSGTSVSAARLTGYLAQWISSQKKPDQLTPKLKKLIKRMSILKKSSRGEYYYFDTDKFRGLI